MRRLAAAVLAAALLATAAPALASPAPASPAALTAGLASVIHADDAASAVIPGTTTEVLAMGDATQVYSQPYPWLCPHFELVTHQLGSASFRVLPGKYGCGWGQLPDFADHDVFWPGGMLATASTVYVYGRKVTELPGSFTAHGGYVARFAASTLAYEGLTPLGNSLGLSSAVAWPGGHWLIGSTPSGDPACAPFASFCAEGLTVWVPSGHEADSSAWRTWATIPASLDAGTVISPFRWGGRWYALTKRGDTWGGTSLEELTAACMAGCSWHLTGKTWPAAPAGSTYSAQIHADPAPGGLSASYAYCGPGRCWPEWLGVTP